MKHEYLPLLSSFYVILVMTTHHLKQLRTVQMWKYLNFLNYILLSALSKGRRHDRTCRELTGCKAKVVRQLAGQNLSTWRRTCQRAYCQHTTGRKISNCECGTVWGEADRRVMHRFDVHGTVRRDIFL